MSVKFCISALRNLVRLSSLLYLISHKYNCDVLGNMQNVCYFRNHPQVQTTRLSSNSGIHLPTGSELVVTGVLCQILSSPDGSAVYFRNQKAKSDFLYDREKRYSGIPVRKKSDIQTIVCRKPVRTKMLHPFEGGALEDVD